MRVLIGLTRETDSRAACPVNGSASGLFLFLWNR
jgi:hypothetical protein